MPTQAFRTAGTTVKANDSAPWVKLNPASPVIDVRSGIEFKHGHIPGAIHARALKILLNMAHLAE